MDILRAVVAGENHHGVPGQAQLVEFGDQPADLLVGLRDHAVVDLQGAFVPRVGLLLLFGGVQIGVGVLQPGLDVERPPAVLLDEPDRLVDDDLGRPGAELAAEQVGEVVVAGGRLVVVDAVGAGQGGPRAAAQVPFAEVPGAVAGLLQQSGHGGYGGIEVIGHPAALVLLGPGKMAVYAVPCREMARHDRGPAGRADARGDVELCEQDSLPGEPVEIWSPQHGMPVAAQVAPAPVVGKHEHEVGPLGGLRRFGGSGRRGSQRGGQGKQ